MLRRSLLMLGTLILPHLVGCERISSKDLPAFKPIANAIQQSSTLSLYEGLPLNEQKAAKDLNGETPLKIDNSAFNSRPLLVKPEDIESLRRLLASADSYYTREPLSCIFHADFAFTWKNSEGQSHILVCFTCSEVLLRHGENVLGLSLQASSQKELASLLKGYRNPKFGPLPPTK